MALKGKVVLPGGKVVDGVAVNIRESTERWTDVSLEDGTTLRVKIAVISVYRAEGEYDPQGQPFYSLNMTPVIAVTDVPEHLRRKTN